MSASLTILLPLAFLAFIPQLRFIGATATASGFVLLTLPTPLYIGTGRPDFPTPVVPFNGCIQDAAL
jgi:hypothetical protein